MPLENKPVITLRSDVLAVRHSLVEYLDKFPIRYIANGMTGGQHLLEVRNMQGPRRATEKALNQTSLTERAYRAGQATYDRIHGIRERNYAVISTTPILGQYIPSYAWPDDWGWYWEYLDAYLFVPEVEFAVNLKNRQIWKPGYHFNASSDSKEEEMKQEFEDMKLFDTLQEASQTALIEGNAYLPSQDNSDAKWAEGTVGGDYAVGTRFDNFTGAPRPLVKYTPATRFYGLANTDPRMMRMQVHPQQWDDKRHTVLVEKYIQRRWSGPMWPNYAIGSTTELDFHPEQMLHLAFHKIFGGLYGYCCAPDTPIITNPDVKEIAEIQPHDKVLGIDGNYHEVTRAFSRDYNDNLIHIETAYNRPFPLKVTPEHQVLAIPRSDIQRYREWGWYKKRLKKLGLKPQKKSQPKFTPKWIPAVNLRLGDGLVLPKLQTKDRESINLYDYAKHYTRNEKWNPPETIPIDKSFMRLAGYYVAEGGFYDKDMHYTLTFTFHEKENEYIDEVVALVEQIFKTKPCIRHHSKFPSATVWVTRKPIATLFGNMFGIGSKNKHVPGWFLQLPDSKLREFMDTYTRGDGHKDGRTTVLATASKKLAIQLSQILRKLGTFTSIGQSYDGHGNTHYMLSSRTDKLAQIPVGDEQFDYLPIRKLSAEPYHGKVYDLEVPGAASYLTNNGIIHNSTLREVLFTLKGYLLMQQFLPQIVEHRADPLLWIRVGGDMTGPAGIKTTWLPKEDDFNLLKTRVASRMPGEDIFTDALTEVKEVYVGRGSAERVNEYITQYKERVLLGLGIPMAAATFSGGGEIKFGTLQFELMDDETRENQGKMRSFINDWIIPKLQLNLGHKMGDGPEMEIALIPPGETAKR